jgi:demethylspheroidene O-methyltransferase
MMQQEISAPLPRPSDDVPPPGWRDRLWDRWLALRDRLLASPAFQRRAAAFPLTRPIARRRAREVFDLVAGFVYSQVLLACVRVRLFDKLAEAPQSAETLAARCALAPEAMQRLLAAAVSLRLVERRSGGRYGLGVLGAPLVGNAGIAAMVEHHASLYVDLVDPLALLRGQARTEALAAYWPYATAAEPGAVEPERVAAYSALMSASQPLVADEILDAYPLARHRCLLDIGGGEGRFLAAAGRRHPHLKLMLFDLPAVAERGRGHLVEQGFGDRVEVHGGDFTRDAIPRGADVISLVRVVHDHDDARVANLLRAAREALPKGGAIVIGEPMAETPGAEPMGDAYFGFYLLAMGRGRPRTAGELAAMLERAGFSQPRLLPSRIPLQARVMVARVE